MSTIEESQQKITPENTTAETKLNNIQQEINDKAGKSQVTNASDGTIDKDETTTNKKKTFRLSLKGPLMGLLKKHKITCQKGQTSMLQDENGDVEPGENVGQEKTSMKQMKSALQGGVSKLRSSLRGLKGHLSSDNEDVVGIDDSCPILDYWRDLLTNNLIDTHIIRNGVFSNKETGRIRSNQPVSWSPTIAQNKKLRTLFDHEIKAEGKIIKYVNRRILITKRTEDGVLIGDFVGEQLTGEEDLSESKFVALLTEQMLFTGVINSKNSEDTISTLKDFTDQLVSQQF